MPSCGIGLGLPYAGTGIDPDALSYFSRAGIASGTVSVPEYSAKNLQAISDHLNSFAAVNLNAVAWAANTAVAPDGTTTADVLTANGTAGVVKSAGMNTPYCVTGSTYTFSIYAKAGTNNFFQIYTGFTAFSGGFANYDLANGVLGTVSGGTATITSVGNGWYRVSFTVSATGATTGVTVLLGIISSATAGRAETNSLATTVQLWGFQCELGSSMTSYVATGANAALGIAGNITVNPRQQILDFVKGIKALGLWNNMVCWPLRSSQNAGTGTTAFSLGGAGTFNGTLTNGPTWGDGGVTKAASNDFISLPTPADFGLPTSSLSGGGILSTNAGVSGGRPICFSGSTGTNDIHLRLNVATASTLSFFFHSTRSGWVYFGPGAVSTRTTNFNFIHTSVGQTTQSAYINGVLGAEATGLGAYNPVNVSENLGLLAKSASLETTFRGTMAFAYMIKSTEADAATISSLYTLYKNTLGVGLGLP